MMFRPPVLVDGPAVLPVTLEEARAFPGIDFDLADAMLEMQIGAATARLDGYRGRLGRAIIHQKWRQDFVPCYRSALRLRFPDVVADSVEAVWIDEAEESSPASVVLEEDVIGPFVRYVGSAVTTGRGILRVSYVCGFGAGPGIVPPPIKLAILTDVAQRLRAGSDQGQIRQFQVDGAFTESFNSPEQSAIGAAKQINDLVRDYRWRNAF